MQEKHTIVTSGETAGEDLKAQLNNLDADIGDVTKAEVKLTVKVEEDDESGNEDEVPTYAAKGREKPDIEVPSLSPDLKLYDYLRLIYEEGPVTNNELIEMSDYGSASGTTNELWDRGLIDREKRSGERAFRFTISEKGKRELAYHDQR